MPSPPISSNLSNHTSSNDGRNVRADLKPISHFFIDDTTGSFTQSASESFGPLSATQFRTTSKVTFAGSRKIYAICKGQLFVQPNENDPDKVNVLLKPYEQPINEISIKYFVYRGLNKVDFFTSGSDPVLAGSESTGTGLNKFLWKQFNDFYALDTSGQSTPSFIAEYLGFPSSNFVQNTTDLIDNYFFKKTTYTDPSNTTESTESSYELPIVPRGLELGSATSSVGIDVVLNNGDLHYEGGTFPFVYDLAFARSADHILDTTSGTTPYEVKLVKEELINFLDIAAFYGLHANGKGKLFENDSVTPLETKTDIYGKISEFNTKNKQYLYLKGNRQRSYNFYDEHVHPEDGNSNNLTLGTSEANVLELNYGAQGWPIHIIDNYPSVVIQFIANKSKANAFVQIGSLLTESTNNFLLPEALLQDESVGTIITDKNYTKPIEFLFHEENGAAISSIVDVIYDGASTFVTEVGETDEFFVKRIDNLFDLINAAPVIKGQDSDLPIVSSNDAQIAVFSDHNNKEVYGSVKIKKVVDKILEIESNFVQRVTYETLLNSTTESPNPYGRSTASGVERHSTKSQNYEEGKNSYYKPLSPYLYGTRDFKDGSSTVRGLFLEHVEGANPTKKILGITGSENQLLVDIILGSNLNNVRLYLNGFLTEGDHFLTTDELRYYKYELMIVGEASDGSLNLYIPITPIEVYSLDLLVFFSSQYSMYVNSEGNPVTSIIQIPD